MWQTVERSWAGSACLICVRFQYVIFWRYCAVCLWRQANFKWLFLGLEGLLSSAGCTSLHSRMILLSWELHYSFKWAWMLDQLFAVSPQLLEITHLGKQNYWCWECLLNMNMAKNNPVKRNEGRTGVLPTGKQLILHQMTLLEWWYKSFTRPHLLSVDPSNALAVRWLEALSGVALQGLKKGRAYENFRKPCERGTTPSQSLVDEEAYFCHRNISRLIHITKYFLAYFDILCKKKKNKKISIGTEIALSICLYFCFIVSTALKSEPY